MNPLHPIVRQLVVCEDVVADPSNSQRHSLVNLISSINSIATPKYPTTCPEFCVYVQLTECRGSGAVTLRVLQADSERVVFCSESRAIRFVGSPLEVMAVAYRIRNCPFPGPGLCWVQLWFEELLLSQQPILLR